MRCSLARFVAILSALAALTASGCNTPTRTRDAGGGNPDPGVDSGPSPGFDAGPGVDAGPRPPLPACEARAEFVYVIDRERRLARFDPRDGSFADVGVISCASSSTSPFSMSVDRDANAWVLFNNGQIRLVSTVDATCGADAFPLSAPFERFGMGFSADASSGTESLFVSGGTFIELLEQTAPARLGRVDPSTRAVSTVGSLSAWPELSGNRAGGLFAFYPASTTFSRVTPGRVVELDKTTGGETRSFDLTAMGGAFTGQYAFAFWGGRFYIFVRGESSTNSEVWRFNLPPEGDGTVTRVVDDAGRIIVGAGVSICAPIDLI